MTQARKSAGQEALETLNRLERVVDTGQRLRRANAALAEWDLRTARVRAKLRQEVAALQSEFDALTLDQPPTRELGESARSVFEGGAS